MLARLLESRAQKKRSMWGTLFSAALHTLAIGAAVFATARAELPPPSDVDVVHWTNPFPAARSETPVSTPAKRRTVRSVLPPTIPVTIPPIDLPAPLIDAVPSVGAPTENATIADEASNGSEAGSPAAPAPAVTSGGETAFTAGEVDRSVSLTRGSRTPRYPEALRARGVQGHVVATFVVNENGRVDMRSIRVVRSDDPLFEQSVVEALSGMKFVPAEVGGRKVRQLVQMPFAFTLSRRVDR